MSNYKKIFCMSVYKIITIITFCVLLMIGSGTIFHAHNSVFMSVLQPAVRIAFLIILILTVIGSYVLLFRFFRNFMHCSACLQLVQFLSPEFHTCITWHTQIASRGNRNASDLRSVRQAGTLKLLCKKSPVESFQPFQNRRIIVNICKCKLCHTVDL